MRPVPLDGALTDAAARSGHRDVQSAKGLDRLLQHLLGACEVGDVHLVERAADGIGHLSALRLRPVQHRNARATLGEQLCGCPSEARRTTDDDGLLALDLHLAPFQGLWWDRQATYNIAHSVRLSGRSSQVFGAVTTS